MNVFEPYSFFSSSSSLPEVATFTAAPATEPATSTVAETTEPAMEIGAVTTCVQPANRTRIMSVINVNNFMVEV